MSFLSWLTHMVYNDRILLTYRMDARTQKFQRDLTFARISEGQAYGMGYQRAVKFLDEMKYLPFKTYVRFIPDVRPAPPVICDKDGQQRVCLETSSTLYDHWRTDSLEKFLSGMVTKAMKLVPIEQKQLLMIIVIIAAAAAGIYLLVM